MMPVASAGKTGTAWPEVFTSEMAPSPTSLASGCTAWSWVPGAGDPGTIMWLLSVPWLLTAWVIGSKREHSKSKHSKSKGSKRTSWKLSFWSSLGSYIASFLPYLLFKALMSPHRFKRKSQWKEGPGIGGYCFLNNHYYGFGHMGKIWTQFWTLIPQLNGWP